ncbi:MAG: hypothetical protein JSW28_10040 [Thermoplasmata archaeon]|nr:MAG: hypothetical protein JSW28_10040 [Thermoplasmata archaeon]
MDEGLIEDESEEGSPEKTGDGKPNQGKLGEVFYHTFIYLTYFFLIALLLSQFELLVQFVVPVIPHGDPFDPPVYRPIYHMG